MRETGHSVVGLVCAACLVLCGSAVWAANITIPDGMMPSSYFNGGGENTPPAGEDNEVELPAIANQSWDLEAFLLNGVQLKVVGGLNMVDGNTQGGAGQAGGSWDMGDIFLATAQIPLYGDAIGNVQGGNGNQNIANVFGYNYVLDVHWESYDPGNVPLTYTVYELDESTLLSVYFDLFEEANPYRYVAEAHNNLGTFEASYIVGVPDGGVDVDGIDFIGNDLHNVAMFDLDFLDNGSGEIDRMYAHATIECGNDSMMGLTGDFAFLPDGGLTVMLLGFGLASLAFVGRKLRR